MLNRPRPPIRSDKTRARQQIAYTDPVLDVAREYAVARPDTFAAVVSNYRWQAASHLVHLATALVDVAEERCKRLIVTMPPRHGKSELVSRYFPAWYLGRYPDRRVMLTSYAATFAADWGRKARDVFMEHAPRIFGMALDQSVASRSAWNVAGHEGGMNTAGAGGPLTGRGFHIGIIDDPIKNAEEALSERIREGVWDWYQTTFATRSEADPEGAIVLVQTRWHDGDLAGRLLKAQEDERGDQWRVINFPAIAEEADILGRQPGEALWPKRYSLERLTQIRDNPANSAYWWSALYQQRPQPLEGGLWKQDWIDLVDPPDRFTVFEQIIQVWDTALKIGQRNDFSVCATFGVLKGEAWLLDLYRDRIESPDLLVKIEEQFKKWRPRVVLIEDASAGSTAIQMLKRSAPAIPIVAVQAVGDKVIRAQAALPFFEAHRVKIVKTIPHLTDLIDELLHFPMATHDDIVDAVTYGVSRVFVKNARQAFSIEG